MVFWVVCRDEGAKRDTARFGPYESEAVARQALEALRTKVLATTTRGLQIFCDYA